MKEQKPSSQFEKTVEENKKLVIEIEELKETVKTLNKEITELKKELGYWENGDYYHDDELGNIIRSIFNFDD